MTGPTACRIAQAPQCIGVESSPGRRATTDLPVPTAAIDAPTVPEHGIVWGHAGQDWSEVDADLTEFELSFPS